jgi:hypothetical protein
MSRELKDTLTDERCGRSDDRGRLKESDDVGRSSTLDQERGASTKAKYGEGVAATV